MVCYDRTIFEIVRVQKNLNIEKIFFKVVQMKFLAMHITNQKLSFDIFTVQTIFMERDLNILMIFDICEETKKITLTSFKLKTDMILGSSKLSSEPMMLWFTVILQRLGRT